MSNSRINRKANVKVKTKREMLQKGDKLNTIAIHKSYDSPGLGEKRKTTLWTHNGKEAERLQDGKIDKFLSSLGAGQVIRTTQVNATDVVLLELADRGVKIRYAHWHSLGFDKGMEPATIAEHYQKAPDSLFRDFIPRPDIVELKHVLSIRNTMVQCYGDAMRRFKQSARNRNVADDEEMLSDPLLAKGMAEVKLFKKSVHNPEGSLELEISRLAKKIPECVLFNKIAGIQGSWILAASVISASGGFDRFDDVASLWHYYGQHVVAGKAPKRAKGVPMDWSPSGRLAMYQLGDVIIKGTDWGGRREANPWRSKFEEFREIEFAKHKETCGCEYPDGHSTARARRKVVKSILKRFLLIVKGEEFIEGHNPLAA